MTIISDKTAFMKRTILVPHDFTEVGNYAIEHAYMIGKATGAPIHLLHIVKRKSLYDAALEKLSAIASEYSEKYNVEIIPKVIRGNLYKSIYAYGIEIDAYIAVMGTHGIKNLKKAMKVVKKFVRIPFILVQSPVIFGEYDRLVVPVDSNLKSRIKFHWVRYLNHLFESKVYIIAHNETDSFRIKSLNNNLRFADKLLEQELIDYEVKRLNSSKNFADKVYNYANDVEGDLVLVMTDNYRKFARDLKSAKNLEYFKKIPIMCVNPRTDIFKAGSFS